MKIARCISIPSADFDEVQGNRTRWIRTILLVLGICVIWIGVDYMAMSPAGIGGRYRDFDVFYLAGHLTLHGQGASAYDPTTFRAAEIADSRGGVTGLIPWAYPPQFEMVVAALALLPKWLAYFVFEGGGLALLLVLLRRISGSRFAEVLVASAPLLEATLVGGQNGVMTASLTAWFVIASLSNRRSAGLPLGLMILKPHLAIGLGLYALARRQWSVIALALSVVAASIILATLVLSPSIWSAFRIGIEESSRGLRVNQFPDVCLISAYAALRSMGASFEAAMAGQVVSAVVAAGMVFYAVLRRLGVRVELGISCMATLAFSPYAFIYDMAVFCVGIALLWPVFATGVSTLRVKLILGLCFIIGNWATVAIEAMGRDATGAAIAVKEQVISVPALGYLILLGTVFVMIARAAGWEPSTIFDGKADHARAALAD